MSTSAAIGQAQGRVRVGSSRKMVCPQCGSEHFYEVQVSQYLTGGFGTVEILPDTDAQTFPLLKCAGCDFPVLPKPEAGRKAGGVYESAKNDFRASVLKGQTFIKALDPVAIETKVVEKAAAQHDLKLLSERVGKLEKPSKNRAEGSTATGNESNTETK